MIYVIVSNQLAQSADCGEFAELSTYSVIQPQVGYFVDKSKAEAKVKEWNKFERQDFINYIFACLQDKAEKDNLLALAESDDLKPLIEALIDLHQDLSEEELYGMSAGIQDWTYDEWEARLNPCSVVGLTPTV